MNTTSRAKQQNLNLVEQAFLSVLLGFVLFICLSFFSVFAYQFWHFGRIYPGVSVAGLDVSGLSPDEAASFITQNLDFLRRGRIVFTNNEVNYIASPGELGLILDPESCTQQAFNIGRSGNLLRRLEDQFNAGYYGLDLPPVLIFDQNFAHRYLASLAEEIDQPVIEASLTIDGTEIVVHPGQSGRSLNIPAAMTPLTSQLEKMQDGVIPLIIEETSPIIVEVTRQAELARSIISQPLILSLPEDEAELDDPWIFEPLALASMLSFEYVQTNGETQYQVTLNSDLLNTFLHELAPSQYSEPENARFMFNDETNLLEVIQPSITGQSLDIEASIQSIQQQLMGGVHEVTLQMIHIPPPVTDDKTGDELGITELIHEEVSYFYGSSSARVQNIRASAASFYGLLIAPGETFSMASALDDISLDNGYAEALIILGGQTIKGIGGGVCQVSTTLFRAAFFAGFPIAERHPHAYRVYYYEKIAGNIIDPKLAGLDATVYVPLVDFKFTNDTPYWLLMETYVNPTYSSIIWKFYSTSDKRLVEWETTGPTNIVEPPKSLYRENPDLEEGEIKQVDWKAEGADVTVTRLVFRDGEPHLEDTFYTHYEPWQEVYEYGPGTEGMPPEESEDE
ncbi:MAG: VanW family protein [Anaerolineaceae bacterium]|nr:VanW family protein [Anaerolineaceae bacterium]